MASRSVTTYSITVNTTGSAGSATGSADSGLLPGELLDVYLDYNALAPATTDVTIAFKGRGGNILAVSNANTDSLFAPRIKPVDNAGAAITDAYDRFALYDKVTVTVGDCDQLTGAVTAYLRVMH